MRRLNSAILWCFLSCSAFATEIVEEAPAEKLKLLLGDIETIHATFEQNARGQESQAGEVWLRKPDLFRLETVAPLSQTIVSDGESLWTYDRDLEQVIISTLSHRVEELPILLLAGNANRLVDDYRVDFYEDETRQYFQLYPLETQSVLGRMSIVFESGVPVSVGVDTTTQQRTIIELDVVQNQDVAMERFDFELPEGTDVIDDRVK